MNWLQWLFGVLRPKPPIPIQLDANELLNLHNAERAKVGLKPFVHDARLQAAAQDHADYMAKVGKMAHFGIGDGDDAARVAKRGYTWSSLDENVAKGQTSAAQVVADWMTSDGHRRNILGHDTDFGGAVAGVYWCTVFATPA